MFYQDSVPLSKEETELTIHRGDFIESIVDRMFYPVYNWGCVPNLSGGLGYAFPNTKSSHIVNTLFACLGVLERGGGAGTLFYGSLNSKWKNLVVQASHNTGNKGSTGVDMHVLVNRWNIKAVNESLLPAIGLLNNNLSSVYLSMIWCAGRLVQLLEKAK